MALSGLCRRTQVLRVIQLSKAPLNFLTEKVLKNAPIALSLYALPKRQFASDRKAYATGEKADKLTPPEGVKKHKPMTSPIITLILPEDNVQKLSLENAEKLARRRDLKLVKIIDYDTKTQRPLYKLMTSAEYFEEGKKMKEQKKKERQLAKKDAKLFTISTKIFEHDLQIKIKQMQKLLQKHHEVRVIISEDGNSAKMEEIESIIEKELKNLFDKASRLSKKTMVKLSFIPIVENELENIDGKENEATNKNKIIK